MEVVEEVALRLGVHVHLLAAARDGGRRAGGPAVRTRSSASGWSGSSRPCSGCATERAQRFVGRTMEVLVEGPSRTDPARLRGRIRHNKTVNFDGLGRRRARWPTVEIASGDEHDARRRGALLRVATTLPERPWRLFGPTGVGQDGGRAGARRPAARAGRGPGRHLVPTRCRSTRACRSLTGAATAEEQERLEHRLVGFVAHRRDVLLGDYMPLAHAEIDAALAAGRDARSCVGGTGLYHARRRWRICRWRRCSRQESELWSRGHPPPDADRRPDMEREQLYRRIDRRVDAIVAAGAEDEVRERPRGRLADRAQGARVRRAAGRRRRRHEAASRNYARRQLTGCARCRTSAAWMSRADTAQVADEVVRMLDAPERGGLRRWRVA